MWRVDFFFKINKRASTFIREMRVRKHVSSTENNKKMALSDHPPPLQVIT